jgi:sn-glycerol 3-phosphate transport system substrate-binding protein
MKRFKAIFVGIVLIAGIVSHAFAGGAPETKAPATVKPVELSLYFPVAVGGPVTSIVDTICQNFNKENPGIKVTAVYTGSYADTMIKAQTGIKSRTPPDMAVIQATELFTLLDMDAIEALDGFVSKDPDKAFINDFYHSFLENSQAKGKLWSLPFQRSTIVLYYNKEMFKRAGLDPSKAPRNWVELVDYAKKLTIRKPDGGIETWGLEIPSTGFQYWMFQALALQNGRQIMNQDGTHVYFDNPEAVEAMQFWIDLTKSHKVMPEGVIEWATVPTDFMQGRTAMMFHTTGNLTNVRKGSTFDFGVAYLPAGKKFGSPTGGGNLYMFKGISEEKKEAAWKFMRFATSPAQAAYFSMSTGYVATRKSAFDTDLLKGYVTGFPQALTARDQLEFAKAELSTHSNSQIYKIVNDAIQAAMVGTKTASQAMQTAQAECDKVLEAFRK